MNILSIDLGKFKSVACMYESDTVDHVFRKIDTTPHAMHDLLVEVEPDRLVIEAGNQAGWVQDLCELLSIPIEVANPTHEAWRWKNVSRKTDRDDALRLAKLSAAGQLPTGSLAWIQDNLSDENDLFLFVEPEGVVCKSKPSKIIDYFISRTPCVYP